MLNNEINYIVSGLECSGTSLMMQVLRKGGLPVTYDDWRVADENNPCGYYELEGGKLINRLMNISLRIIEWRRFDGKTYKN